MNLDYGEKEKKFGASIVVIFLTRVLYFVCDLALFNKICPNNGRSCALNYDTANKGQADAWLAIEAAKILPGLSIPNYPNPPQPNIAFVGHAVHDAQKSGTPDLRGTVPRLRFGL